MVENKEEIDWKWAGTGIALMVVFVLSSLLIVVSGSNMDENIMGLVLSSSSLSVIGGVIGILVGFNLLW
jgi:hypothetical protein